MRMLTELRVEPLARPAFAAERVDHIANAAQVSIYELYRAAHAHRALFVRQIVVAAIQAAGAVARRVRAHHRDRREARAIREALYDLDDRTLHDLGIHRSEIASIAAEVTGAAERTRVRTLWTPNALPR